MTKREDIQGHELPPKDDPVWKSRLGTYNLGLEVGYDRGYVAGRNEIIENTETVTNAVITRLEIALNDLRKL